MEKQLTSKKMKQIISAILLFQSIICMAQVGIGIENPEAAVHIGKNVKLKDVIHVEESMIDYPKHLISDAKGNLAVFTGLPTNLMFKNVLTAKMNKNVYIPNDNTPDRNVIYEEESLNLNSKIVVPPNETYVLEIAYSIPALYGATGNPKGDFGVFLKKKQGDGIFEKINTSVRVFSPSLSNANAVTAIGRAISCTYVDTVKNDTNVPLEIVYDVYGFTDHINLRNYTITFGSYDDRVDHQNYNWGRGVFFITINELIE